MTLTAEQYAEWAHRLREAAADAQRAAVALGPEPPRSRVPAAVELDKLAQEASDKAGREFVREFCARKREQERQAARHGESGTDRPA